MAIDVLCDGVNDDISTVVEWILHVGREEGVVDDYEDAAGVGSGSNRADVDEAQSGVGRGLDPDELGGIGNVLANVDLNLGGEGDLDAVSFCDLCEVPVGAAIDIRDGDDMGARGQALKDDGGGGRPGRKGQGMLGVLDSRDRFLEVGAVGIATARVLKFAKGLAQAGLGEGSRQRNGLDDGAGDGIVG